MLLLVGSAFGAAWWTASSEAGSAWLLSQMPGLSVTRPQGALLGRFEASQVELQIPGAGRLRVEGLSWQGLEPGPASKRLRLRISIAELHAARLEWRGSSRPEEASEPPASLELPVELDIHSLHIGEARLGGADSVLMRDVDAAVELGGDGGLTHRVERLAFSWGRVRVKASGQMATAAPFQLDAQLEAVQQQAEALLPWSATSHASGPLEALVVQATIRSRAAPGHPAQALDGRVTVHPFASWPLGDLTLTTEALDLAAFHGALPVTSLSGEATATSSGIDRPGVLTAELTNAAAGALNEGRLPVHRLNLDLRGLPGKLGDLDLHAFAAELGTPALPAGRIRATGRWTPRRWTLATVFSDVQTAGVDARAPALTLSGPLHFGAESWERPDARGPVQVKGVLEGQVARRESLRHVQLKVDASLSPERIEIRAAEARAADAVAGIAGTAQHDAPTDSWKIKGTGTLADFDPAVWASGAIEARWRKGPHRLSATGDFDLRVPGSAAARPLLDTLSALRGEARVALARSTLAGVPLQGEASWRNDDGAAATADLALEVGGNNVRLQGRVGLGAGGSADAWDAVVTAPALNRLAPLCNLLRPPGSSGAAPAGSVLASARLTGRWPNLTSRGELSATGLRFGTASAAKAQANWQLGTAARAPLEAEVSLSKAGFDGSPVESLALRMAGTADAHHIDLETESRGPAPSWSATLLPATSRSAPDPSATTAIAVAMLPATSPGSAPRTDAPGPTHPGRAGPKRSDAAPSAAATRDLPAAVVLRADGSLLRGTVNGPATLIAAASAAPGAQLTRPSFDAPTGWRGQLRQVMVRGAAEPGAAWLNAQDIGLQARWAEGSARLDLAPGRAEILGAGLRWTRFGWQAGDSRFPMRLDVDAELDPLPVAPLLRRAQPEFGWGGDLSVGGRIVVHSGASVTADVVLERRSGDLSVTDETGTQTLGLTDLRLGVAAANGVWNFTHAVAGKTLGAAAGAVVARTTPGATWPTASTPIHGVMELQVANLGTWGPWVPAGWRLGGALRTSASIGGRVGAPELTGQVVGHGLSVRNFLEGVSVHDGDLAIALRGSSARIDHFSAQAGEGSAQIEGNASLGDAPRAQLRVKAQNFQVLGRVDRRLVASGDAQLRLDRELLALAGSFAIDEGLIDFGGGQAPTLGDDVRVRRGKSAAPAGSPAPPAPANPAGPPGIATAGFALPGPGSGRLGDGFVPSPSRRVALDVAIAMGERLRVRGHGLDSGLRGEVRLSSPSGRLAVDGTVFAVDGTYAAYSQKLVIDRGELSFAGPMDNPRLDIEATRPDLDIRVGIAVTGTALTPRVRLFSEPELADMDKLSWLVLGRANEGLARAETALLQRAALALLAGEGGGLSNGISKSLGLDEVSVRQGEGEVKEAIASFAKQLSRGWHVGYERGLNATSGSWQLLYRVARGFTVRAQSGDDKAVDMIWTWRWQ
ncbi:MAG: translocation/assembly module TamB domain-containing protein [Rhizobacter sp.]